MSQEAISDADLAAALLNISHISSDISQKAHRTMLLAKERSIEPLMGLVRTGTLMQRRSALRCLWKLLLEYDLYQPDLLETLLWVCESETDRNCRIIALEAIVLSFVSLPQQVPEQAFTQFLLDHDDVIRARAINMVARYKFNFCVPWLVLLVDDEQDYIQDLAWGALRRIKTPTAILAIQEINRREWP